LPSVPGYNIRNERELINVAVTRAKKKLIVVGDYSAIKKKSDIKDDYYNLVEYVKSNGTYTVAPNVEDDSKRFKDYDSKAEKEFLSTITHFTTVYKNIYVKSKVKVASVLTIDNIKERQYFHMAEFDFVLFDSITKAPKIVIEVDGPEHNNDKTVIERDKKKNEICKSKDIKLIRIPNSYVRRYEFIKYMIFKNLSA